MFSSASVCLFVCLSEGYAENTRPVFTKFDGKAAHGPRKKPLDFGGNSHDLILGLGYG